MTRQPAADPFRALGLEARAGLTDDEVHAAWRRTASATHPDREDGGDPERFAEAAAAYTALRTRFGRGEVLAELGAGRAVARASGFAGSFSENLPPCTLSSPGVDHNAPTSIVPSGFGFCTILLGVRRCLST